MATLDTAEQALEYIRQINPQWCCFQDYANNSALGTQQAARLADLLGYAITADKKQYYKKPVTAYWDELIKKECKPVEYIVDGLLPVGLCIFAAPPKTGKSWLCLDLCCAVGDLPKVGGCPPNSSFMGRKVSTGSCLYLALQDSESRLINRMRALGISEQNNNCDVRFWCQAPLLGHGLIDALQAWKEDASNAKLIVIDTLAKVKPTTSKAVNSYNADYNILAPLQRFALDNNLAVVLVTHNSKAKAFRLDDPFECITGSMGQMGVADTMWMISGKRQDREKKFLATSRDGVDVSEVVEMVDLRWQPLGNIEQRQHELELQAYLSSPVRQTILECVEQSASKKYRCKYEQLWEQVATRKNVYPFDTADALARAMPKMYRFMLEQDQIGHEKDSHNVHTFLKKPALQ